MKSHLKLLSILAVIAYLFVVPGNTNAQTGPVARWSFNETSDTILYDSSGNGNTAYLHSGTRVPGVSGNALSFNGTSGYAWANNSVSLNMNNQITIECWVNAQQLNPVTGSGQTFIRKENAYCLGIGTGGKIGLQIYDGSGGWHGSWTLSSQSIQMSTWYHIAGTWDGQTMKVYINGVQDPTTFGYNGLAASNTNAVYIGENYQTSDGTYERLNGALDELMVYNYALSADSIAAYYATMCSVPVLIPCTPNPTFNKKPLFRWYSNKLISNYLIQIDTIQQFSSPIVSVAVTDPFYTPGTDLPFGIIYWRVCNNSDTSAWSALSSFYISDSTKVIKNWVVVTPPPTSNNLTSITYGNGQYVAVGDNGTILTSPDGLTWTSQTSGTNSNLLSVTYGNGQYSVVGTTYYTGGGGYHYWLPTLSSPDGITWTGHTGYYTILFTFGNGTVTYCNGLYVIVVKMVEAGLVLASWDDSTWNLSKSGYISFASVTFGNSQYIGVGGGNSTFGYVPIMTSPDLTNWSADTTGSAAGNPQTLNSVIYSNGQFVAVGNMGKVVMSSSGTTWSCPLSGISNNLNSVTYGSGQYVAAGDAGTILNSPDGINWALDLSGTINNFNSVINGNSQFVAVGDNGTILISSGIPTATKGKQKIQSLSSVLKVQSRNSLLTISLPSAMLGKAVDLAVYSISGREIMRTRVKSNAERFTVPVSFSYGSYILVANDGSRKASLRFVAVR